MGSILYTIGYAGYPDISSFISELKRYGITTLIDIRRRPYVAFFDQYEGNRLRNTLTREDLAYIRFDGDFGMTADEDEEIPESPVDFEEAAKTEDFAKGIARLRFGIEKGLVPVVMGEAMDPAMCPRGLLIARVMSDLGYTVIHILPGGTKDHAELEKQIAEFARADMKSEGSEEYQLSLIPGNDAAGSSLNDDDILAEGYRRLNRILF